MYFIGDTHGVRPVFTIIDKHKLMGENLIHVGDFGLGFQDIRHDVSNLLTLDEMLIESGNTLYVIRGNHDNPIFWNKRAGLYLPKFHNLKLIDDFEIRVIEEKTVLFAGGAISIDRLIRSSEFPPSYWVDEKFKYDKGKILNVLDSVKKIDIVVTHNAPGFAYPQNDYVDIVDYYCELEKQHGVDLRSEIREERSQIGDFYKNIIAKGFTPSHWIYGHFHNTKKQVVSGTEFKLLNINELYEIKTKSSI